MGRRGREGRAAPPKEEEDRRSDIPSSLSEVPNNAHGLGEGRTRAIGTEDTWQILGQTETSSPRAELLRRFIYTCRRKWVRSLFVSPFPSCSPIFSANVTLYHSLALEQLCNVALRLPSSFTPLQSPIRILPSRRLIPCLRSLPPSSPSRRPRRAAH